MCTSGLSLSVQVGVVMQPPVEKDVSGDVTHAGL